MLRAMNNLQLMLSVPLLAAFSVLPAQGESKKGDKAKEPAPAAERAKKREDSKTTKADPAIKAIDDFIKKQSVDKKAIGWRNRLKRPPKLEFAKDSNYFWHIETEVGSIKVRLLTDSTPMHCSSGIYLARLGFYDGVNFHRIIPGFMAQGGCPNGDGRGGPGYKYDGEFPKNMRSHDKPGLLSMANAGPGTDGSQFFLTFVPTKNLDRRHTVWGEVVDGMDTVKQLERRGTRENNGVIGRAGPRMLRTWVSVEKKPLLKPKTGAAPATGGSKQGAAKTGSGK